MSDARPLPAHYCAACHWPLVCSNADCPTVATPALGELARLATEAAKLRAPWPDTAALDDEGWSRPWGEFVAACSPEVVLLLDAMDKMRVDVECHDPGRGTPLHVGYKWKLTGHLHQRTIRDAARSLTPERPADAS